MAARRRRARAQGPPARNNLPRHDRLHFCGAAITLLPFVDRLFIVYLSFFSYLSSLQSFLVLPELGVLVLYHFYRSGCWVLFFVYHSFIVPDSGYHVFIILGMAAVWSLRPASAQFVLVRFAPHKGLGFRV